MKKYWQTLSLLFLVTLLLVIRIPLMSSQGATFVDKSPTIVQSEISSPNEKEIFPEIREKPANNNSKNFPVIVDGAILFNYSSDIQGIPAQDRANRTAEKIKAIAKNSAISINSLKIAKFKGLTVITTEEELVLTLLEADAQLVNRPLNELAEEYLEKVKDAILKYREQKSFNQQIIPILWVVVESIIFIILVILLKKNLNRINRQTTVWQTTLFRPLRIQGFQLFSVEQEANLFLALVKLIYWVILVVIFFIYLSLISIYLPQTKQLGKAIFNYFYTLLQIITKALISYLPNLFTIVLTIIIAYYIIRFCRLFFNAINTGTISLPGFYQDWAKPTERLTVILIMALAFAIIFPLLPGANSPAFRGISIFVGALFTLGGASAIANLVGGFIMIYTRAFQVGDYVQVADVQGDIIEKTILSTRIRTPKNEIVTIPNANLLNSNVKNFTTAFREINQPLILHTTITLGYDVPWTKVHQVLIEAARSTPSILKHPAPFVLQTSLGDFYVSYELNVYSNQPSTMHQIYSQLHQNIQNKCNEAGIEILSPQYSAIRDGNHNTIPQDYLSQDYTPPGFRVHPIGQVLNYLSHQPHQRKTIDHNDHQ